MSSESEEGAMSERELEEQLEEQKQTWLWKTGSGDAQVRGGYIEGINDAKAIVRRSYAEAAELREVVKHAESESKRLYEANVDRLVRITELEAEAAELRERVGELEGALRELRENCRPHGGESPGEAGLQDIVCDVVDAALSQANAQAKLEGREEGEHGAKLEGLGGGAL